MTTWHRILFSSLLAASLAACADGTSDGSAASTTSASAESTTSAGDGAMPPPGEHPAPPPEAVAACDGASAGDPCDFSAHDHDVTGTCVAGPHDATKLACCPEGGPGAPPDAPPPGEPPAPPAEALAACANLAADAACSVTLDGHTLEGTCRARSADDPLACAPGAPPPHP